MKHTSLAARADRTIVDVTVRVTSRCPSCEASGPAIIFVPSERILREAFTILNLSLAYATFKPRLTQRGLIAFVDDRMTKSRALVIDTDGSEINLRRFNVDAIFGDDASGSWAGDFLSARIKVPRQKASKRIATRYKLLWIALATIDPKLAKEVLD